MADTSNTQRRKIITIIKKALDPETKFGAYIEVARTQRQYGDKFPFDTLRFDCLLPLCYVGDEVGKRWLYDRYEKKLKLKDIAAAYHIKHITVITRRIESVLDTTVDCMHQDQAWFILGVFKVEYGNADPDTI